MTRLRQETFASDIATSLDLHHKRQHSATDINLKRPVHPLSIPIFFHLCLLFVLEKKIIGCSQIGAIDWMRQNKIFQWNSLKTSWDYLEERAGALSWWWWPFIPKCSSKFSQDLNVISCCHCCFILPRTTPLASPHNMTITFYLGF